MSEEAVHFRNRATDCRALAKSARNPMDAEMLEEIADELDQEARKIEAAKVSRTTRTRSGASPAR